MQVFIRYIFKNMFEKKGRFFLLIFSIMISTALFVFSLGAVDVILNGLTDTLKHTADGKEITIYSNTDDVFLTEKDFDTSGMTDIEGKLTMIGVINENDKITYVSMVGKKDCSKYAVEGSIPEGESGPVCAISQRVADERDLSINDKIEVYVGGEKTEFTIKALAAPSGMFYQDDKEEFRILLPYEYMNGLMGAQGRYNRIDASVTGDSVKFCEKFNDNNENVKASSLTDLSMYKTMMSSTESTVYIMFAIVCIICCIIIHGAFKLIITERTTVIGTFMSQGATKKKIQNILLMESLLYGLIGGIVGVFIGELILYYVNRISSPLSDYGIYMDFHMSPALIVSGIIFAAAMCVLSALMPVRKIRKFPVKDVILGRLEPKHKGGEIRFVIGALLLVFSVFGALCKAKWTDDMSFIIAAAGFIGLIMFLRKFLKFASGWLSNIFRKRTSIFLALNNIKTSKLLRGNVTLLVISFSSVLLIASVGTSLTNVVEDAYKELSYDYTVYNILDNNSADTTTDKIVEKLNSLDCIDKNTIMPVYQTMTTIGKDYAVIEAADPEKYADYNQYLKLWNGKYKEYVEALKNSDGNSLMLSDTVAKHAKKDVGDEIEIEVDGSKHTFTVVGTFDAKLYNNGHVILAKPETLRELFHYKEASYITFKINGDQETAEKEFKSFLANLGATYQSRDDAMEENVEGNKMVVQILSIFAYLALIVASIGIFNNIAISFQQRRREFAVMASVGLNAKGRKRLVFTENMFCVFWSLVLSVPFTILTCMTATKMMKKLEMPLTITFDIAALPKYAVVLIAVIFIASLSTMKKSKKLNVVQELKYE